MSALRNTDWIVPPVSPSAPMRASTFSSAGLSVCGAARRMLSKYMPYWRSRGSAARYASIFSRPMARISGRMNAVTDWNWL